MSRKHVWAAVQGLVTMLLLVLLVRSLDLESLRRVFLRLPLWFYVVSLFVVVGGQFLYAWRWRLLLVAAGVDVPYMLLLRQYFIGIFLNNFLPSTVGGDVAKVFLLGRVHGYRPVTASVLLDRALGLVLMSACAAALLWMLVAPPFAVRVARMTVTAVSVVSAVLLALAAVGTGGLPARVTRLGSRAVAVAERLQRLRQDMAPGLTSVPLLARATAVVVTYFLSITAVYQGFFGMVMGHAPTFGRTMAVVMASAVLTNIPISLNGLGLREQLHSVLLVPFGVPKEAAVAISLLLFAHTIVASLLGLIFWLQTDVVPSNPTPLET